MSIFCLPKGSCSIVIMLFIRYHAFKHYFFRTGVARGLVFRFSCSRARRGAGIRARQPDRREPVITRPDPMSPAEWEALLAASRDEVEPPGDDDEEYLDPEGCVLPPDEDLAAIEAEAARFAAEHAADAVYLAREETAELAGQVAADQARKRGPRGPGLPGSADRVPGRSGGPAGGSGPGMPGCRAGSAALHGFLETAVDSGPAGRGQSDDEIIGLITAADRAEASACYLKHAAAAELIRRRPAPGCTLAGRARMPEAYLDSAGDEIRWALAGNRPARTGCCPWPMTWTSGSPDQGAVPGRPAAALQGGDHRPADRAAGPGRGPPGRGADPGPGPGP